MCSRYYYDYDALREIVSPVWKGDALEAVKEERDVYPAQRAVVLTGRKGEMAVETMRWGFLQKNKTGLLINARAESVMEKPSFRDSVQHRRCVIPAGHFYEWDAKKNKVVFYRQSRNPLYFAGCYNCFENEDHFVIITTKANSSMEKVHDRMPLILERDELEAWLLDEVFAEKILKKVPEQLQQFREYEQQSLF